MEIIPNSQECYEADQSELKDECGWVKELSTEVLKLSGQLLKFHSFLFEVNADISETVHCCCGD